MKKCWLLTLAGLIILMFCAPAFAGNEIYLGSSTGAPVKFTGTGSAGMGGLGADNFLVNFNIVNLSATGTGSLLSGPGFYSIVNAGASVYGSSSCGTGCFTLGQSAPLAFKYGSTAGASDLLTGNLLLVELVQTGQSGVFNDKLVVNFTATGGALQSAFANNNGSVQLTIKFTTSQDLALIMNTQTLMAKVVSGAVFPVPEPGSLSLLSGGLIGLAFLCKKKKVFFG